jgi:amidophosphoribosyltransferase
VIVSKGVVSSRKVAHSDTITPCMFEYVYFARPDSVLNGISVYKSRIAMGEALAKQVKKIFANHMDIDVIIPVRFSSFLL